MRNFGEFFNNQVEYAGAIIMSRTDIVDEEKAMQCGASPQSEQKSGYHYHTY